MKLAILTLATAATLSTAAFAAPVTVDGGTVKINGEIVNAACAVTSQTANQDVNLGQYTPASVLAATNGTSPVPFQIKLTGCSSIQDQNNAAIGFNGQTIGATDLLAVSSGTNAPGATGVGIQIMDSNGTALGFNGAYSGSRPVIVGNDTVFNFTANYKATSNTAPTPGLANAVVNFKVSYN